MSNNTTETETDVTKIAKELFPKTNYKTNSERNEITVDIDPVAKGGEERDGIGRIGGVDESDDKPIPVLCHDCNYVAYVSQHILDTKGAPICPICQEYYLNEMGKDRKRVNIPESPEAKSGVAKINDWLEDMFGWKAEVI